MESARADQRREAGLRTRTRLLDAVLDLLARRGEDGVTLRELIRALNKRMDDLADLANQNDLFPEPGF